MKIEIRDRDRHETLVRIDGHVLLSNIASGMLFGLDIKDRLPEGKTFQVNCNESELDYRLKSKRDPMIYEKMMKISEKIINHIYDELTGFYFKEAIK